MLAVVSFKFAHLNRKSCVFACDIQIYINGRFLKCILDFRRVMRISFFVVENNVNLKSNSSDIYFKIRYATMLCGLGLPSVNFAPKKALCIARSLLGKKSPTFYFGL